MNLNNCFVFLTFPTLIYFRASWLQQNMGTFRIAVSQHLHSNENNRMDISHDNSNTFVSRYTVAHLVNSIGPTSLNWSSCCSHIQLWIHCNEFLWKSLQNEWHVERIGPIFLCTWVDRCWFGIKYITYHSCPVVYQCLYKWYIYTSETLERNAFKRNIVFYITNNLNNPCIMNLMMQ